MTFNFSNIPVVDDDPYTSASNPNGQNAAPRPRFNLFTLADAMRPKPPIEWIIDKLIVAGSVNLVYGESGSLKTYALICMLLRAAEGKDWIDFKTTQCPAFIIDEEVGELPIQRRLEEVARGYDIDENAPVWGLSLSGFNLLNKNDLEYLRRYIEGSRARLVLIDALSDVTPGADENSVKEMKPLFLSLRRIAQDTHAAIILIHHANKSNNKNNYRGSSTIKADVDLMMEIKSEPGKDIINFEVIKNRYGAPIRFSALAQWENLDPKKFWLIPNPKQSKPVSTNTYNKAERFVLLYLFNHGESKSDAITASIDPLVDPAPKSVSNAISKLKADKLIERTDNGNVGQVGTYKLTALGNQEAENL